MGRLNTLAYLHDLGRVVVAACLLQWSSDVDHLLVLAACAPSRRQAAQRPGGLLLLPQALRQQDCKNMVLIWVHWRLSHHPARLTFAAHAPTALHYMECDVCVMHHVVRHTKELNLDVS